ncbi:MAG TPA: galactokinase family protein [Rectinemataceae bacterium]|nr:galactokinase family protein [Rectinemataceae bacterium]
MKDIVALHRAEFEEYPQIVATAPGLIKLLGDQTPSAEGLVLAAAISYDVSVSISERRDSSLRFFAADLGERKRTGSASLKYKKEDRWANYPKAILDKFNRSGYVTTGLNVTIAGEVPMGLGFASSSALLLAMTMALKSQFKLILKNDEVADFAWKAESDFFGLPGRVDDFLIAACSTPHAATIVDLRTARRHSLPFFDGDWAVVLTDSKVPRLPATIEEEQRGGSVRQALAILDPSGKKNIRDFAPEEIEELMGQLPESVRRRALHLSEEHRRVKEAEQALVDGDEASFGKILARSHTSLRNLYEVSCPEVDWLQKRAMETDGILCSRLTGQGFGGCTVSIMKRESVDDYRRRLEEYERIFGFRPAVYETDLEGSMRVID